jgi:hypothetical protein
MTPVEIQMLVSSNPINGARNRSADGSSFEVALNPELAIPANAKAITVTVEEATIWWSVANIETGINDKFYITGPDVNDVIQNFVLTIGEGLYNLSALNTAMLRELDNANAKPGIISLSSDEATQRVTIRFEDQFTSIDFTQPNTCRIMLGFEVGVVGPFGATVPEEPLAQNIAAFNSVNYFVIHTDLISQGIRINNRYNQTVAIVPITAAPRSQIVYSPFNPPKIDSPDLAGSKRTNLRFWLTDDQNRLVNTNSEYWSARIVIRYFLLDK